MTPSKPSLETLPTEVLQLIFLHSLEVNLPRASPILSHALSNQLLYTWLIRLAFSSTNQGSQTDFFTPDFLPPPLDFWSISWQERADLQTALLTCKWCTLPLIRKCQQEYVQHAISQKCIHLSFASEDQNTLDNLDSLFTPQILTETYDKSPEGRKGKGDIVIPATISISKSKSKSTESANKESTTPGTDTETTTSTATTTPRPIDHKLSIWFHHGAIQIRQTHEIYYETNLYKLPSSPTLFPARIPSKLLRPPWSATQFEFLHLLASDFYLDEEELVAERSGPITTRLIRHRRIEPFVKLIRMSFRARNCRVRASWPIKEAHFRLILRYAELEKGRRGRGGELEADPFARAVIDERWDDVPALVKGEILKAAGVQDEV